MNETSFSPEHEEILDTSTFSLVAMIGFFLSLVGIFSLQYTPVMPFSILGATLGAFSLLLAKKRRFGFVSNMLAVLAVSISSIVLSMGVYGRSLETNYELEQARKVCELYLENVAKGDYDRVYFLAGQDPAKAEIPAPPEMAMSRAPTIPLRTDPTHIAITNRKSPPKWKFVALESEYASEGAYFYKLKYVDEGQPKLQTYFLSAKKNAKKWDPSKTAINWHVVSLAEAPR